VKEREHEWAECMRAANRGCAQSYRRFLAAITSTLPKIVAYDLARLGLPTSDREDVMQEVLLAIHLKRHTWDESRPLLPWLRAIVHYKTLDFARKHHREAHLPLAEDTAAPQTQQCSLAVIEPLVDNLPKRQKSVVISLVIEGATVQETAIRLQISKNAVYVALHRGVTALLTKLNEVIE
jgi:RNA polymerase sigma-70 factor (ECF subfamily)